MAAVAGHARRHLPSVGALLDGASIDFAALPPEAQLGLMEFFESLQTWAGDQGITPAEAMKLVGREFTRRLEESGQVASDAIGRQAELEQMAQEALDGKRAHQMVGAPPCFCDECVASARESGEL